VSLKIHVAKVFFHVLGIANKKSALIMQLMAYKQVNPGLLGNYPLSNT